MFISGGVVGTTTAERLREPAKEFGTRIFFLIEASRALHASRNDGGRRTEGRRQRAEDRGQRTEDRRQRTEDRRRKEDCEYRILNKECRVMKLGLPRSAAPRRQ